MDHSLNLSKTTFYSSEWILIHQLGYWYPQKPCYWPKLCSVYILYMLLALCWTVTESYLSHPYSTCLPCCLSCRESTLWIQGGDCREPWTDVWQGLHGWAGEAGLLSLSLRLQAETWGLWRCSGPPLKLYLPAGLWGYSQGFPNIRGTVVSLSLVLG